MSANGAATTGAAESGSVIIKAPSTRTKRESIGFAVAIIVGLGGLAVAGVGLGRYVQAGSLSNLDQINAIIMMAAGGGGGVLFLAVGIVGSVKNLKVYNTYRNTVRLLSDIVDALRDDPQDDEKIKRLMREIKKAQIDIYAIHHFDKRTWIPLIRSLIFFIKTDVLRSLVEEGIVDLGEYHTTFGSPLHTACQSNASWDMFQFILARSPPEMLNKATHKGGIGGVFAPYMGYTPLYLTIESDQTAKALALLDAGADPGLAYTDDDGEEHYPIHIAIQRGNVAVVKLLIEKEVNLTVRDSQDHNLLKFAIDNADYTNFEKITNICQLLVDGGVERDEEVLEVLHQKQRDYAAWKEASTSTGQPRDLGTIKKRDPLLSSD